MPAPHKALVLLLGAAACLAWATPVWAARYAVLVGISDYGSPRQNLEGAANDARAMSDVLVRRWGVPAGNVQLLLDREATRENILQALRRLQSTTLAGDEVVIFLSGHGTSALDQDAVAALPHGTGAFIPHGIDVSTPERAEAGLLIGRRDLLPLLSALDAGGRNLWVISDSCFSGNQARSVAFGGSPLPARYLPLPTDRRVISQQQYLRQRLAGYRAPPPYPYARTAYLASAHEGELARDIPARELQRYPTLSGQPQGAMTDALLRVLEGRLPADFDGDGQLSLSEVHRAVSDFMASRAYGHSPQRLPSVREDSRDLGQRPVLGTRGVAVAGVAGSAPAALSVRLPRQPDALAQAAVGIEGVQPTDRDDADIVVAPAKSAGQVQVLRSGELLSEMAASDTAALRAKLLQLSWTHRIRQQALRHQRGELALEIVPGELGGTFVIGQHLHFVARPVAASWLVLLNADSRGRVSVLYPYVRHELQPLAAGQAHAIPGSGPQQQIRVQEPAGMDMQLAFAFESRPEGLERLLGAVDMEPGDPRLLALERMIETASGRFRFAPGYLRVVRP